LGSVGILVNNAGNVSVSGGVMKERTEDWDSVIETQLNSVFLLSKLAELKEIGVPAMAVTVDVTNRAGLEPALNKTHSGINDSP
jgi:NAD(P)-dependent dehydrogenase (short-subunit alcohol dehydrogenase family)